MDSLLYLKPLLISFFLAIFFTLVIKKFAQRAKILAIPGGRRRHLGPKPLLGGIAIIGAYLLALLLSPELVITKDILGLFAASGFILIIGIVDDIKPLSWKTQLAAQVFIALIIIFFGIRVDYMTNPFGGAIKLDQIQFSIFPEGEQVPYGAGNFQFSILSSLFIILWIVGMTNVVNWLDGLDGLAGGVSLIGAITLFFLSISPLVNQPPLGILAITLVGAVLGFLLFNFPPAKIFLGTSGTMFLGFMLATLAIFSGGKIATVLLVLSVPFLDACWVVFERIKNKNFPFQGDRRHLHYKLLSLGFSQKQIILFFYSMSALFGIFALMFQTVAKLVAFLLLTALVIFFIFYITYFAQRKKTVRH